MTLWINFSSKSDAGSWNIHLPAQCNGDGQRNKQLLDAPTPWGALGVRGEQLSDWGRGEPMSVTSSWHLVNFMHISSYGSQFRKLGRTCALETSAPYCHNIETQWASFWGREPESWNQWVESLQLRIDCRKGRDMAFQDFELVGSSSIASFNSLSPS